MNKTASNFLTPENRLDESLLRAALTQILPATVAAYRLDHSAEHGTVAIRFRLQQITAEQEGGWFGVVYAREGWQDIEQAQPAQSLEIGADWLDTPVAETNHFLHGRVAVQEGNVRASLYPDLSYAWSFATQESADWRMPAQEGNAADVIEVFTK